MIKYNKDEITSEVYGIVKKAHINAIKSIKHFVTLLDLNPTLFNHLYSIDTIIDSERFLLLGEKTIAYYNSIDNQIHIFQSYINKLLNSEEGTNKDKIKYSLSHTLIHETLHANRDIIIKNPITPTNLRFFRYKSKYEELYNKYGNLINNKYKDTQVISLKHYKDHLEIIGYDHEIRSFVIYNLNNNEIDNSFIQNIFNKDMVLFDISKKFKHCAEIISPPYINEDTMNAPLYINNQFKHIEEMNSYEKKENEKLINKQRNVEEILVDSLSYIILKTAKENTIDLNAIYEHMLKHDKTPEFEIGLYLYKELGIDFIKWYILSCYEDEYNNKLNKIYKDKYKEVLTNLSNIYI